MSTGVLIVGIGQIGMGYDLDLDPHKYIYSHARAFSQHPEFKLVAAVDPDQFKRQVFTQNYRCPSYVDVETALGMHQPELVVLANPTTFHKETLMAVLSKSKPKVVLCEKPLSYDAEEGSLMVNACIESGAKLYVNYMRRSVPGFIEVKRLLDAGIIEAPVKGVAWYSKGFLHNGSHIFNLLEYLLGPMKGATLINSGRIWGDVDPEPDVFIRFEKGEVVLLAAWEEAYSHYTVELLSKTGRLRCDFGGESIQWQKAMSNNVNDDSKVLSKRLRIIISGMRRYQWYVVNELAKSIKHEDFELCSGAEALRTLSSMQSIIKVV